MGQGALSKPARAFFGFIPFWAGWEVVFFGRERYFFAVSAEFFFGVFFGVFVVFFGCFRAFFLSFFRALARIFFGFFFRRRHEKKGNSRSEAGRTVVAGPK